MGKDDNDSEGNGSSGGVENADPSFVAMRLTQDVCCLQRELRILLARHAGIVGGVSTVQKDELFTLVAQIIYKAAADAMSALRQSICKSYDVLPDSVAKIICFISAAACWEEIALPSLEARLLRLACFVDVDSVRKLVREAFSNSSFELVQEKLRYEALQQHVAWVVEALWPPHGVATA